MWFNDQSHGRLNCSWPKELITRRQLSSGNIKQRIMWYYFFQVWSEHTQETWLCILTSRRVSSRFESNLLVIFPRWLLPLSGRLRIILALEKAIKTSIRSHGSSPLIEISCVRDLNEQRPGDSNHDLANQFYFYSLVLWKWNTGIE